MQDLGSWLLFLGTNGLVFLSSYALANRLLRTNRNGLDILTSAGILYFSQVTFSVLCLGVIVQRLNSLSLIIFHSCLSGLILFWLHPYLRSPWPWLRRQLRELSTPRDVWLYIFMLLFILEIGLIFWKIVFLPAYVYDVLTYHLPPAVAWFQAGKIPSLLDTSVTRINGQALGLSVLSYWFFVFIRNDFLVELPQLLWILLLVPAALSILRQTGVDKRWAILFALLVFFIPALLVQANTAQDHLALNVSFIIALLFFFNFLRTRNHAYLLLAGMTLGLALGYKLVGFVYLGLAWFLCGYFILRTAPELLSDQKQRFRLLRTAGLSMSLSLLLGGYWYVRNFWLFGRLQGAFEDRTNMFTLGIHQGWLSVASLRWGLLRQNLESFPGRIADVQGMYGPDLPYISGFGPQFTAFGLMAVGLAAWFLTKSTARRDPIQIFPYSALLLLCFYFLLYYSPYNYRLFSFFPILMILYGAIWLARMDLFQRGWRGVAIQSLALVCLVWSALGTAVPQGTDLSKLSSFLGLQAKDRTTANYYAGANGNHLPYRFISTCIPPDEPIAYIGDEDTWIYIYYDPQWRRRLHFLDSDRYFRWQVDGSVTPKPALYAELERSGIRLLSLCINDRSFEVHDPAFTKLYDGLYYYRGKHDAAL